MAGFGRYTPGQGFQSVAPNLPSGAVGGALGNAINRGGGGSSRGGGGSSSGGGSSGGGRTPEPTVVIKGNEVLINGVGFSVVPGQQAQFLSSRGLSGGSYQTALAEAKRQDADYARAQQEIQQRKDEEARRLQTQKLLETQKQQSLKESVLLQFEKIAQKRVEDIAREEEKKIKEIKDREGNVRGYEYNDMSISSDEGLQNQFEKKVGEVFNQKFIEETAKAAPQNAKILAQLEKKGTVAERINYFTQKAMRAQEGFEKEVYQREANKIANAIKEKNYAKLIALAPTTTLKGLGVTASGALLEASVGTINDITQLTAGGAGKALVAGLLSGEIKIGTAASDSLKMYKEYFKANPSSAFGRTVGAIFDVGEIGAIAGKSGKIGQLAKLKIAEKALVKAGKNVDNVIKINLKNLKEIGSIKTIRKVLTDNEIGKYLSGSLTKTELEDITRRVATVKKIDLKVPTKISPDSIKKLNNYKKALQEAQREFKKPDYAKIKKISKKVETPYKFELKGKALFSRQKIGGTPKSRKVITINKGKSIVKKYKTPNGLDFKDLTLKGNKNLKNIKIKSQSEIDAIRYFVRGKMDKKFPITKAEKAALKRRYGKEFASRFQGQLDILEPQVKRAVGTLNRKGFMTTTSGFTPNSSIQHIVFKGKKTIDMISAAKDAGVKLKDIGDGQIEASVEQIGKTLKQVDNTFLDFASRVKPRTLDFIEKSFKKLPKGDVTIKELKKFEGAVFSGKKGGYSEAITIDKNGWTKGVKEFKDKYKVEYVVQPNGKATFKYYLRAPEGGGKTMLSPLFKQARQGDYKLMGTVLDYVNPKGMSISKVRDKLFMPKTGVGRTAFGTLNYSASAVGWRKIYGKVGDYRMTLKQAEKRTVRQLVSPLELRTTQRFRGYTNTGKKFRRTEFEAQYLNAMISKNGMTNGQLADVVKKEIKSFVTDNASGIVKVKKEIYTPVVANIQKNMIEMRYKLRAMNGKKSLLDKFKDLSKRLQDSQMAAARFRAGMNKRASASLMNFNRGVNNFDPLGALELKKLLNRKIDLSNPKLEFADPMLNSLRGLDVQLPKFKLEGIGREYLEFLTRRTILLRRSVEILRRRGINVQKLLPRIKQLDRAITRQRPIQRVRQRQLQANKQVEVKRNINISRGRNIRLRLPRIKLPEKIKEIPLGLEGGKSKMRNLPLTKNSFRIEIKRGNKYIKLNNKLYTERDAKNKLAFNLDRDKSRTARIVNVGKGRTSIISSAERNYLARNSKKFRSYRILNKKKTNLSSVRLIEKRKYFNDLERLSKKRRR